jgi:hypothetical protein
MCVVNFFLVGVIEVIDVVIPFELLAGNIVNQMTLSLFIDNLLFVHQ